MADKWREVPGGSDQHARQFSDSLLQLDEAALLADWSRQHGEAGALRGWYWTLYGDVLRGKRVVEVGSGRGFDAIALASRGVAMTCCDIVESNLEIIRRVARARGLDIATLHIRDLADFERLPAGFDAVWAIGSIHHMPFEAAREESHALLAKLAPRGRWIELSYPRERWVREGSPSFERWGQMTDGERTPWAEWYDMEKLKQRLWPWRLEPVLERRFESDAYVWLDAVVAGRGEDRPVARRAVPPPGGSLQAPGPLWTYAWQMPLGPSPAGRAVTVEVDCVVERGSIGFSLLDPREDRFVSREVIVEARTGEQRLYLPTDRFDTDVRLLVRSATALGASAWRFAALELRETL